MTEGPKKKCLTFHRERTTWIALETINDLLGLKMKDPKAVTGSTSLGDSKEAMVPTSYTENGNSERRCGLSIYS